MYRRTKITAALATIQWKDNEAIPLKGTVERKKNQSWILYPVNISFKSSVEVDFFRHTKERINHQQACTISSVKIYLLRKKKKIPYGNWDPHKEMKSIVDIN